MNIAVFASGGGSNFRVITDKASAGSIRDAAVVLLVTNNSRCGAAAFARERGIPVAHLSSHTHSEPAALERAMLEVLEAHEVELIVLAGYMKRLPSGVIRRYPGRILNIHPALLPRFGGKGMYGMHVHEAVLRSGEKKTGVSIHFVTDEYDAGKIIEQREVPVMPGDSPETLQKRVLEVEHELYWRVVDRVISSVTGSATRARRAADRV